MMVAIAPSFAIAQSNPRPELQPVNTSVMALTPKQRTAKGSLLADGVYLYGQSAQSEQIGQEYLVFQLRQGKIRGAIYYPQSEFNCFTGVIASDQIKLLIRDPFDNRRYPYAIALVSADSITHRQPSQVNITLKGYVPLPELSPNDYRLLQVCLSQSP